MKSRSIAAAALLLLSPLSAVLADSGTEAASFLDIPVGGRAAALGAAYTAAANDAYAPVWNPGGLGFVASPELAAMHLSYLETISYEYASYVHPIKPGHALGLGIQYLSPGKINSTDINGNSQGDFVGHYAAYSLSYGQTLTPMLSLGLTGKIIDAKIADTSAKAYAFDAGVMAQARQDLRLAAAVSNVGTKLKFINQGDSLPANFRVGGFYSPRSYLNISAEGVYRFAGLASFHSGVEWFPTKQLSLRAGFRSDTLKKLSGFSGVTTGLGLHLWGQEFDYAWVPLGDLGATNYFSLVIRFGATAEGNITRPVSQ